MKTSEILVAAKALIDTPEKWTQGSYAKTKQGFGCWPENPDAVCFCSVGAVMKVGCDKEIFIDEAKSALHFASYDQNIIRFNDTHSHAEVMDAWDRAIAERVAAGD